MLYLSSNINESIIHEKMNACLDCNRLKSTKKNITYNVLFLQTKKRIHPRMFHSSLIHPDKKVSDSGSFLKIIEIAYEDSV